MVASSTPVAPSSPRRLKQTATTPYLPEEPDAGVAVSIGGLGSTPAAGTGASAADDPFADPWADPLDELG